MPHRRTIRRLTALTALLPVAGLAVGCSTTSGGDGDTSAFTVASPYAVQSLDPYGSAGAAIGTQLANQAVFNRLVKADATGQLGPDLAESWTPDADATTWTFTLRQGVKFSDGSAFDAEDVVSSFKRFTEGKNPNAGSFTGVTATAGADGTVAFDSPAPDPALPGKLTLFFVTASETPAEFPAKPVGTGPFTVANFTPGETLEMAPNAAYFDGAPKLQKLVFRQIPEISSRMTALANNEIQATWGVPDDQLAGLQGNPDVKVETVASTSVYTMWFNSGRDSLSDATVRKALWQAVDFNTIISSLYPQTGQPSDSVLAPPVFGHAAQTPVAYDPEAAKKALEEAGFDFSKTLQIQFSGAEYRQFVEAVAADLAKVGVKAEPAEKEAAVFLEDLLGMKWDINFQALSTPSFDAATNLGRLYPCSAKRTGFCDADLDKILAEAGSTADTTARQELYAQASTIIWDKAVGMYPMQVKIAYTWRSNVEGLAASPTYLPDFSTVTLS
ncbi:ABC transporter substrate-binding protein [Phytomonospora endophytica]|uniref:Peptide/nickel transport system substrate-binding protein n=1 Tax=Phytomonospora endophytica TaxID=714109 RepID=A0A841FKZ7_9ACTN|nr:ABC transporter substrate-binding protein [Phytomonospora endophytica]MBB6038011.1 peptide/nickel transport system substrate-binding protein [Phytomonospora endophytica]GIG68910.1 ABC transporter substrate-binding protein [Phytomonospora endophytica]